MIRSKFQVSTLSRLLFTKSKTLISRKTLIQPPLLTTQPHHRQFCISIEDAHRSIQDLLAQVEKEKLRRDSNVRPAGINVDGKKVEEEEEEEDYMGVSAEIEKLEKKIAKENDVRGKIGDDGDIVWEMDEESESESEDDDDDEERAKDMRLKEEKILKRKIGRHKELMNTFINSGTLDDAFKSMSKLDKFEEKHFHLRPEYRVIGELLSRFKVATGKDKFLLAQKLNRAMRLVEKREAFDPNNPANYSVIQREEVGPSVEVMDDADVDMNREAIKGDNEEEDFDDMKERDNILLEKLTAIDKKLEEKLAALDHTFGKKGKLLEEEIRELAEERNSLTEKKRIPMYRKGFDVHLIDMTKGGQVVKYTAILACGNYNGVVGYAKAKGPAVPIALQKAYEKCFQNLHYVDRYEDHTIAHAIQTTYKKTKVYLWPAGTTTGMKAGRTVQTILNLAGYKNVKSKVIGSRNPHNTLKALFQALNAIETPKDVQEKFGRTVVESYLL